MKKNIIYACFVLMMCACSTASMVNITGTKMSKLELGMSKQEVTNILGDGYTIAEKRTENGSLIEVLSYRDFYKNDEFYMFLFSDNKLERWYRELLPKYEK